MIIPPQGVQGGISDDWQMTIPGSEAPGTYLVLASSRTGSPTIPGKNWFAYFRFYRPTEPYFDRSWPLSDFERLP
jgi:hypothetical protein